MLSLERFYQKCQAAFTLCIGGLKTNRCWIYDTSENNYKIQDQFAKYFKECCGRVVGQNFSLKYFPKEDVFLSKVSLK